MSKNDKRTLYVGGLQDDVVVEHLRAAFIPFGEVVDVNIPLDNQTGQHRGFGFVEYENAADASEAIFNMNNGELFGRVLTVNIAKAMTVTENSLKPIWAADADSYYEKQGWGEAEEVDGGVVDDGKQDDGLMPTEPVHRGVGAHR
mmetsp:Transcript_3104/g.7378  ORF Transcript_3104/g.7378 Transcript_3104/m.7378 type:complete len:145 (-) Transcript_3104:30-464(-)